MSTAAVLEQPKFDLALLRPREEAIAYLQTQLKKGGEIKALRIRTGQELDQARAAKLEWTNTNTDLLKELFDDPRIVEECNDWVGKIYPEYAEFGNFVEQFYAEMEHRLKRLKAVIKQIQKLPSETRATAPASAVPAAPSASQGPVIPGEAAPATAAAQVFAPRQPAEPLRGFVLTFNADDGCKSALVEFLDSLDVDVALVDEATAGPGGVTEAMESTRDASFALVLTGEPQPDRCFELGLCVGRLGLKRVCVLHPQHAQLQADPRGLTHVVMDSGGGWQLVLARHLKRAGLGVDLNRLC